jgi:prephenate dehydrogenase
VTTRFERIAVLGLGLLGGSVALAARERGVARLVVGATRRRDVLEAALARAAIDESGDYEEAVRGAELVVLATPVFAMREVAGRIAPHLDPGALLTDVGSVKGVLAETLPGVLPRGVRYVGAHPMAGSHLAGFDHARADLFAGAPCIVIGASGDAAVDRVCAFWSALGTRVVLREPAAHDVDVAWMSHVPHLLAFAFAKALAAAPASAAEVAGPGFRDFTRIAHGDPELWADILAANGKAMVAPLQAVGAALAELGRAVEAGEPEALERCLAAARTALSGAAGPSPARDGRASGSPSRSPRADGPVGARSVKPIDE